MSETQITDCSQHAAELRRMQRLVNESRARVIDLQRQVTTLAGTLASLDRENDFNRARVIHVRKSISWRVTRPIRRARRLVKRLFAKAGS